MSTLRKEQRESLLMRLERMRSMAESGEIKEASDKATADESLSKLASADITTLSADELDSIAGELDQMAGYFYKQAEELPAANMAVHKEQSAGAAGSTIPSAPGAIKNTNDSDEKSQGGGPGAAMHPAMAGTVNDDTTDASGSPAPSHTDGPGLGAQNDRKEPAGHEMANDGIKSAGDGPGLDGHDGNPTHKGSKADPKEEEKGKGGDAAGAELHEGKDGMKHAADDDDDDDDDEKSESKGKKEMPAFIKEKMKDKKEKEASDGMSMTARAIEGDIFERLTEVVAGASIDNYATKLAEARAAIIQEMQKEAGGIENLPPALREQAMKKKKEDKGENGTDEEDKKPPFMKGDDKKSDKEEDKEEKKEKEAADLTSRLTSLMGI